MCLPPFSCRWVSGIRCGSPAPSCPPSACLGRSSVSSWPPRAAAVRSVAPRLFVLCGSAGAWRRKGGCSYLAAAGATLAPPSAGLP
eukprot:6003108-Pyramimonas_sp.AAC.1